MRLVSKCASGNAAKLAIRRAIRITSDNLSSIHIHEKIGYRHVGTLKEVGVKFGKLLDVEIMQYLYK